MGCETNCVCVCDLLSTRSRCSRTVASSRGAASDARFRFSPPTPAQWATPTYPQQAAGELKTRRFPLGNAFGQLGVRAAQSSPDSASSCVSLPQPVPLPRGARAAAVACGARHSGAVTPHGAPPRSGVEDEAVTRGREAVGSKKILLVRHLCTASFVSDDCEAARSFDATRGISAPQSSQIVSATRHLCVTS